MTTYYKQTNNTEGGKTDYCKYKCYNNIVEKNNVNSPYFSNTSRNSRNAQRLSSGATRFLNGITVYGNIGEPPSTLISPQLYNKDIRNNVVPNDNVKQYYVTQSLRLSLTNRR